MLDSALGMTSYTWWPVQAEIVKTTSVCSYDRAGYALSDPGPLPRTGRQIAEELHTLLAAAGEPGPYILAGHSLGGLDARLFATAYPADVAGVALIDATPDDAFDNAGRTSPHDQVRNGADDGLPLVLRDHVSGVRSKPLFPAGGESRQGGLQLIAPRPFELLVGLRRGAVWDLSGFDGAAGQHDERDAAQSSRLPRLHPSGTTAAARQ